MGFVFDIDSDVMMVMTSFALFHCFCCCAFCLRARAALCGIFLSFCASIYTHCARARRRLAPYSFVRVFCVVVVLLCRHFIIVVLAWWVVFFPIVILLFFCAHTWFVVCFLRALRNFAKPYFYLSPIYIPIISVVNRSVPILLSNPSGLSIRVMNCSLSL